MVNENSKTELKRLCTMNPLEMAERLHKAEQDVKVAKGQYEGALVIIKQLEAQGKQTVEFWQWAKETIKSNDELIGKLTAKIAAQQAQIDSLMLEHCPGEMTPEQLANWGANQRPVSPEVQTEIDKAIGNKV